MSYLRDLIEADEAWQRAQDAYPENADCDGTKDCPSEHHWMTCGKKRRELHPELYAKIDARPSRGPLDDLLKR